MRISELIYRLVTFSDEHGDVIVTHEDGREIDILLTGHEPATGLDVVACRLCCVNTHRDDAIADRRKEAARIYNDRDTTFEIGES